MRRFALLLPVLFAGALAACNGTGPGTNFSIDASGGDNATITTDGNGQVAIKAEGFQGSFKIPKVTINAEDFDLNGVKLYPKSTVTDFHIAGGETANGSGEGSVKVAFESPASVATVAQWFRDAMIQRGFKVEADGTGLKGTTDEGDRFTLGLAGDGDQTKGVLEVQG